MSLRGAEWLRGEAEANQKDSTLRSEQAPQSLAIIVLLVASLQLAMMIVGPLICPNS